MARQTIASGILPVYVNETGTRQAIAAGVYVNETSGGSPPATATPAAFGMIEEIIIAPRLMIAE